MIADKKTFDEFIARLETAKEVTVGARRYTSVKCPIWTDPSHSPIYIQDLLEHRGITPHQAAKIFWRMQNRTLSQRLDDRFRRILTFDQLGGIWLLDGQRFGALAKLLGITIKVVRDTGMDNVISGPIWTCTTDGKAVESVEYPAARYEFAP